MLQRLGSDIDRSYKINLEKRSKITLTDIKIIYCSWLVWVVVIASYIGSGCVEN